MTDQRTRVAVTGGNGSLGRFVVAELAEAYEVLVIDRDIRGCTTPSVELDIRDLEALDKALAGTQGLIHLAALDAIVQAPHEQFFDVNSYGTWSVLEAARRAGVSRVVHCSSASVYGLDHTNPLFKAAYLPIDEDHPILPTSPYALTKRFGEILSSVFSERFGMSTCSIRLTGVVVPELVQVLIDLLGETNETWQEYPVPICENVSTKMDDNIMKYRDYIDARDAARLFRAALEQHGKGFAIYNCAAEDTLITCPTLDFAACIDSALPEVRDPDLFKRNPRASPLSSARAKAALKWSPVHSWAESAGERWSHRKNAADEL